LIGMPRLVDAALVGLGGSIGSVARYLVGVTAVALLGPAFPYGTLAVNVTGAFAAGLLLGFGDVRGVSDATRLLLLTGFLGGYTTYSAFAVETVRLAEQQGWVAAGANVAATLVLGLGAAGAGVLLGRNY
jgi:CrcB protein